MVSDTSLFNVINFIPITTIFNVVALAVRDNSKL